MKQQVRTLYTVDFNRSVYVRTEHVTERCNWAGQSNVRVPETGVDGILTLVDGQSYDLVIEKDLRFLSVQVRFTTQKAKLRNGDDSSFYAVGLRSIKTNTKETTTRKRRNGDYDILFVLCGNEDCYSIPESELPASGTTLGPKYSRYKIKTMSVQ